MRITASKLRENVYRILDEVIETGAAVEVVRKGSIVKLVAEKPVSKLERLKKGSVFYRRSRRHHRDGLVVELVPELHELSRYPRPRPPVPG